MIITCLYIYSFRTFLLQIIRNYNLIDIMKHNGHDIKRLANVYLIQIQHYRDETRDT